MSTLNSFAFPNRHNFCNMKGFILIASNIISKWLDNLNFPSTFQNYLIILIFPPVLLFLFPLSALLAVGVFSLPNVNSKHFLPGVSSTAAPTLPTRNRVWRLVGQKRGRDGVPKNGANPRGSFPHPTNQFCNAHPWHGQHSGRKTLRTRLWLSRPQCLLSGGADILLSKRIQ